MRVLVSLTAMVGVGFAGFHLRDVYWGPKSTEQPVRLVPLKEIETDRAIVFVHGLDGDPVTTWKSRRDGPSWADLIASDSRAYPGESPPLSLDKFSIYTLDYRALYASEATIQEAAVHIADRLSSEPLFKRYNHVWFVAHSLGGILIKKVLIIYSEQDRDALLDRTAGVFLFGVPTRGSPLAEAWAVERFAVLTWVIGRRYNVVKDLRPESATAFLDSMENSWVDLLLKRQRTPRYRTPFVYCAYEVNSIFGLFKVVDALFAATRCEENPHPFPRDHLTIVKPIDVEDDPHVWLRERIRRSSENLRALVRYEYSSGMSPLATLVDNFRARHRKLPDSSGVLELPERIEYANKKSELTAKELGLADVEYRGATAADLMESVANANECIRVSISSDRRVITVDVSGALRVCMRGPSILNICADQRC